MHCCPKPPEMMANRPAQISDSSFHSIWSLLKVERGSSILESIEGDSVDVTVRLFILIPIEGDYR